MYTTHTCKNGTSRSTCSFVVGVKDCLSNSGYMNPTNTNAGSWRDCSRRGWCNGGFRRSLSDDIRPSFKQFQCTTGQWADNSQSGGANILTNDYFSLAAAKEITTTNLSNYFTSNELAALTQFDWYKTSSNISKKWPNSSELAPWWTRSPAYLGSRVFGRIWTNGYPSTGNASLTDTGLSPFGCV